MVMFDELFIDLRALYGPMNLGMSFLVLHLGSIEHWGSNVYWSSASVLLCAQVLHHVHLVDSTLLVEQIV